MYPVALRDEIRTWVLIQGKSQRAAANHLGSHVTPLLSSCWRSRQRTSVSISAGVQDASARCRSATH